MVKCQLNISIEFQWVGVIKLNKIFHVLFEWPLQQYQKPKSRIFSQSENNQSQGIRENY